MGGNGHIRPIARGLRLPPDGVVYAGSFPGIDVLCDQQVMADARHSWPLILLSREQGAGRSCT
jgi:hypothetical protein